MKKISIFFLSFLLIANSYSAPIDTLWVAANEAYTAGNYAEAARQYEKILASGVESADVYYNLGNAYYKQNILGQSILNYERALRLSPENEDILHNLEMARLLQLDKIETMPEFVFAKWYKSILQVASANVWGALSIVMFAAFLLLLLVYFFTRRYGLRKLSFFTSLFVLLLSLVFFVFALQQRKNRIDNSQAIIFSPVVTIKGSPDTKGTDLFIVHEGLKVQITDEINGWSRIKLGDGSQGWAPSESMQRI